MVCVACLPSLSLQATVAVFHPKQEDRYCQAFVSLKKKKTILLLFNWNFFSQWSYQLYRSNNKQIIFVLENEASLLTEVGTEIDEIKLELRPLRFLEVSEGRSVVASNEIDNQWIASIRDIACEVEDVVDNSCTTSTSNNGGRETNDTEFFVRNQKISDQLGGENHRNNWVKNLSESALFLKDDDLVGIDKAQQQLLGWLGQELQRTMTSVPIQVHDQRALRKAKEKIDPKINLDSLSYRELLEALVSFLEPRRYLIVIYDVWSNQLWQDISIALPANRNGSRILLTTRKEDVASFESGTVNNILRLKPLPSDESLALCARKLLLARVDNARHILNLQQEWIRKAKECKMHDILREFAVSISKSIKFVAKSDGMEEVEDDGTPVVDRSKEKR
ncbi:hypothetical protein F3Y22_tig00117048pilonHSYRG00240 [Hibiscus syriacus]|uniref:Uncharacterized protein n=1 Tax=Hibiscus syriacus TaxID=106335 RepID=A0A6A2X7Q3_HIBSY|nr:hypothetical protein F3Y22_tig00117048pilonHSYRG00240 [Hibiscus syriacus]